jgi:Pyruvate/2-oxoacid:ferredoxin oxidoreductase gamma subunit
VLSGLKSQSVFFPSQEKRAARVWGLVKIDKNDILSKQLEPSDIAIVFDPAYAKEPVDASKDGGVIFINTSQKPNITSMKKRSIKTFSIDATAVLEGASTEMVMLGALAKSLTKISMKAIKSAAGPNVKGPLNAVDEGYKNVKQVR